MKKRELAEIILQELLDNGMIDLTCGEAYWQEGKKECISMIEERLDHYVIVEGIPVE